MKKRRGGGDCQAVEHPYEGFLLDSTEKRSVQLTGLQQVIVGTLRGKTCTDITH
jgi:hypothetical protein